MGSNDFSAVNEFSRSSEMKIQDTSRQDLRLEKTFSVRKTALILTVMILVIACTIYLGHKYALLVSADKVVPASNLRFTTLKRGNLTREVTAQGRIFAANSPTLFSGEPGFVRLLVKAGDSVKKAKSSRRLSVQS